MVLILIVVVVSLGVSFLCSLMEAALLTITPGYARSLQDQRFSSGRILTRFKQNIGPPISAILILNTISHTIGAAVSGALVDHYYGNQALLWFSIIFTILILYLSEIIPKQIGAVFNKQVAVVIAAPLLWMVRLFYPLILTTQWVANLFSRSPVESGVTPQELISMAKIGREEGVLDSLESVVIRNIIHLDRVTAKHVLTPRSVVFKLADDTVMADIRYTISEWSYSRIPIYSHEHPDQVIGYVTQRDLFRELLLGNNGRRIQEIMRPLKTIVESTALDTLFVEMIESREHIRSVVDEYGVFMGLVTMEDIIEEIVGKEIVDEYDSVGDLQNYARALYWRKKNKP